MKMKILVTQTIVSDSKRFLANVAKELPEDVKEFHIIDYSIAWLGKGGYSDRLAVVINGKQEILSRFFTDSQTYDDFKDLEYRTTKSDNWIKNRVLYMLADPSISGTIVETI